MKKTWEILERACYHCKKCRLSEMRTNVVIGKGNKKAEIMFIGEGPGQQEDLQGQPFVGPAGQLLDKMLAAVDLKLEDVYITNVVKCRPPGNRDPHDDEKQSCINYLRYQFALIRPKVIVCLGRIAATTIIDPNFKITKQRGQWYERKGCYIIATYHPSALLRDETKKRPAWEDMQAIRKKLNEITKKEHENNE